MLSVCVRGKGLVSIKYSVMALCKISCSQIFVPENVRLFFLFFIFFNGPAQSPVKPSVGKEAETKSPCGLYLSRCVEQELHIEVRSGEGKTWVRWEVTGAPFSMVQVYDAGIKVLPVVQECCSLRQLLKGD